MSNFNCKVYRLNIEPHPNADAIELAVVGEYRSVVRKGQFKSGSLGVYIPEASVIPTNIINVLGLNGKLAGPAKNRVKAIKLRGIVSQGLIYPVDSGADCGGPFIVLPPDEGEGVETLHPVKEGDDVMNILGITKYEPTIPVHMAGEGWNAHQYTLKYDIENIKKYPHLFNEAEPVLITEKLHGTWVCFGYHPDAPQAIVTSKGLSARGIAFKFNEANVDNLYVRTYREVGESILNALRIIMGEGVAVYVLGEIYGKGVQDLTYGTAKPQFRAFDIYVKNENKGRYLSGNEFLAVCSQAGIIPVPILGRGTYTREEINTLTNGKDNITGTNIREGVVVRPLINERTDQEIGRVILKSVSEDYLFRGEGTEYN